MRAWVAIGGAVLLYMHANVTTSYAFDADDRPLWPNGEVRLHLALGNSPLYLDGTSPDQTAGVALAFWNPYMQRVQLSAVPGSTASRALDNRLNNVFFSDTIYGQSFGRDVLAVALTRYNAATRIEADVIVNSAEDWDAYRGGLRYHPNFTPIPELRRVLAHEFGHVLGLDHPDEAGQSVQALMNSTMGNLDFTTLDDQDGIAALYGRGIDNPAIVPAFDPRLPLDGAVATGVEVTLHATLLAGTNPLVYQWLKDGVALPGANSTTYTINYARVSDSGKYALRASNEVGAGNSREATLTVAPPVFPVLRFGYPQNVTVEVGYGASFSAELDQGTRPLTYQWFRDGVAIPDGATGFLSVPSVTLDQSGQRYTVRVTNEAGSTEGSARLTVQPPQAPSISYQPQPAEVFEGETVSLNCQAGGSGTLAYYWLKDGVFLADAIRGPHLTLLSVTGADAGEYRCLVTNKFGSALSSPACIVVTLRRPAVNLGTAQTVVWSEQLSLSSGISDLLYPATFQWYKDGRLVPGLTASNLSIRSDWTTAGEYFVVANLPGKTVTGATTRVYVVPATTPGGWTEAHRDGDIVYFLFSESSRLERFDLATESFLTPIAFRQKPGAMTVRNGFAYVAFGNTVSRFDVNAPAEVSLFGVTHPVSALFHYRDHLYASSAGLNQGRHQSLTSYNLITSQVIATSNDYYELGRGYALDEVNARVFAGAMDSGDDPLVSIGLNADGTFGEFRSWGGSGATKAFVSEDGGWVMTNGGLFLSTTDFYQAGGTTRFSTMTFLPGARLLVSRGADLTVYDLSLHELGGMHLPIPAERLFVRSGEVFAFSNAPTSNHGVAWERVPVATSPALAPRIDANNLRYSPDGVWLDRDGCVLLFSKIHRNIFRWSTEEKRYLDPIPLLGAPDIATYAPATHRMFLRNAEGRVSTLSLDPPVQEQPFGPLLPPTADMVEVGDHVLFVAGFSFWTFRVVSGDGSRYLPPPAGNYTRTFDWNPTKRRLYYFDEHSTSDRLYVLPLNPDGTFGPEQERDYGASIEKRDPIRSSPTGNEIVLGNGLRIDGETLLLQRTLPNTIDDATWLDQDLFTLRRTPEGGEVQHWSVPNRNLAGTYPFEGWPLRLFALDQTRLLLLTIKAGTVRFAFLDRTMVDAGAARPKRPVDARLANLSTRADVGTGDQITIAGFVVSGDRPKRLLIRGVGPALGPLGVTQAISDPKITIYRDQVLMAENNNWNSSDASAFSATGAFPLPIGSRDAAIVLDLDPGLYTAHLSGLSNSAGVGLVEVYDYDAAPGGSRLVNISTRAKVGTGEKIMIPGLVIHGTESTSVLVRAVGPGLAEHNVAGYLADPRVAILNAQGRVVAENNDWSTENVSVLAAAMVQTGAFSLPAGSSDAALVALLPPGRYTVHASGADNTTGIVLVEVYLVP